MATYMTFKRAWWKKNLKWHGGREPEAGPKMNKKYWDTEEEARDYCQKMNADPRNFPSPNPLAIKYEFSEVSKPKNR